MNGSRHYFCLFKLLLVACVAQGIVAAAAPALTEPSSPPQSAAVILNLEGVIGPAAADYVERGLAEANIRHAPIVILTLDTPGGLDGSMRDIVRAILASPVPVAAYVSPSGARAASAGTYILYASHVAAMAPGTNLGAATPVQLFGLNLPPAERQKKAESPEEPGRSSASTEIPADTMKTKMTNDAAAYIRSLANIRDRNADWAEEAVRKAVSLAADEAAGKHVVDFVANDIPDLLAKANGRKVNVMGVSRTLATAGIARETIALGWRTKVLAVITEPELAYLLFLLGIFGIVFELTHPGMAAPGVFGAISLVVGMYGLHHLPIDYAAAGLVLLGLGLMIAEAFVPAYGALGFGGVLAFAVGSLMLFDTAVPGFRLPFAVVAVASIVAGGLFGIVLTLLLRARRRPLVTGEVTLIGLSGEVLAWSDAGGQVQVGPERWNASADLPLRPGQHIRVIGRDGLTLRVGPDATKPF